MLGLDQLEIEIWGLVPVTLEWLRVNILPVYMHLNLGNLLLLSWDTLRKRDPS